MNIPELSAPKFLGFGMVNDQACNGSIMNIFYILCLRAAVIAGADIWILVLKEMELSSIHRSVTVAPLNPEF